MEPTTSTDQTRIIKIMEEHQRPTEYKVVIEFLQNKMEALNIDENDIKKFDKIPGPNFLNLTKEELHRHFKLEYAQADAWLMPSTYFVQLSISLKDLIS